MTKYLIKLKPLDTFFFSKENKYRNKQGKIETEYYQVSDYFPQQTTVLGMLRYYILLMNNQIPITNKKTAEELIGPKSFDIGSKKKNFRIINEISPVFILDKDDKFYFKNPKDLVLKTIVQEGNEIIKPKYLTRTEAPFKTNLTDDPQLMKEYNEKEGLSDFLFHDKNSFLSIEYDEEFNKKDKPKIPNGIFIKKEKVGITKNKKGGTLENAYYKQVFFSLKEGWVFGFIAYLKNDTLNNHKGYVYMSAEKNPFEISFKKWDGDLLPDISISNTNAPKIVLLSDTYISDYKPADFQFAISSTKTFRFLETEVREGNNYYSSDPIKAKAIKRSGKYNLLEKGSVFYFKDIDQMEKFTENLKKEENFNQIGYNKHLKIQ